jgi:type IX secretion system PorP/SprF family membrane protein
MQIKTKYKILLAITLLAFLPVKSQQLPVYSQFMMNRFLINPARTGAYGYTAINLIAREQWLGFKDAPSTHAISFQTRLLQQSYMSKGRSPRKKYGKSIFRSGRIGLGGYLYSDNTGITNRTGGQLSYSYHITFQQSQLSFGLSTSILQFKLKNDEIILYDDEDPFLLGNKHTLYIPDASVGIYYTYPSLFAGISATQLFQSSLKFGDAGGKQYELLRYYYTIVGYKYQLDRYYEIEPSLLMKTNEQLYSQFDINFRVYYKREYWGGLSFRSGSYKGNLGSALIFMGGVKVDKFIFGYAFDYSLNKIQRHSFGSHELSAAIQFGDSPQRYRWLRRY